MVYFSGINTFVSNGGPKPLDAVSLEFAINNNSRPLYGEGSENVQAFMDTNVMVQGTLILNHNQDPDNNIKDDQDLVITYETTSPVLKNGTYINKTSIKNQTIEEIQILSINQALSPIADNLTDIYQFIGKRLA
jgi:hypothetical protein